MYISDGMDNLIIAHQLIQHAQRAEDQRKGKPVESKSIVDIMQEDQAKISGDIPTEDIYSNGLLQPKTDDVQLNLSDLFARLKELESPQASNKPQADNPQTDNPPQQIQQVQVQVQQVVERKFSMKYNELAKVDGLVRRSSNQAETDRYQFDFSDGVTFKITDKWSNRSTTIWGDPHVDVSDVEGDRDGDFQDMKGSNDHTTMMLQDGTRVTFTARDNGLIEAVDIFKGNQHLSGVGEGSAKWGTQNALFDAQVQTDTGVACATPTGDTVYAGGDGNDWFTSDGKLLWGKTTGPVVNTRPAATLQLEYQETTRQQVSVQINKQA